MSTLDDWISDACGALELPPDSLSNELRDDLLGLTRDVAHGVARVGGPMTCYLLGIAVGRGQHPSIALAALTALLPVEQSEGAQAASAGPGATA